MVKEYTPEQFQPQVSSEKSPEEAVNLTGPAIIRRLHVDDRHVEGSFLTLKIHELSLPLRIPCDATMTFGTEMATAAEYFKRVIERGDMIDAIILPSDGTAFPVECYWIHIEYVGDPSQAGIFSRKDDGLFAMRTKAGEKGERIATKCLRDQFGHSFPESMFRVPDRGSVNPSPLGDGEY